MQKWKIIQILITLPKQQLVTALLLLFIAASLTSNSIVALYFLNDKKATKDEHKIEVDYYKQLLKTKDSIDYVKDKSTLDFMQDQMKIGYTHRAEIDSLKFKIENQKK